MQICDTFGLSFLHTLVSIIFPTGNACVPADESPPWPGSFSVGRVQAFCRNCFWPTHLPTNFLRQGLINLSTHLKNVVMGDSGSWKVTPGKTRVHTWIWMTSALQEIVRRISFDDDDSQCIQELDSNLRFSFHGMTTVWTHQAVLWTRVRQS